MSMFKSWVEDTTGRRKWWAVQEQIDIPTRPWTVKEYSFDTPPHSRVPLPQNWCVLWNPPTHTHFE